MEPTTLALDRTIVGNDEPVGLLDEQELQTAVAARDPAERIRLGAAFGAAGLLRSYALYRAFEQAAAVEPARGQHWHDYQQHRAPRTREREAQVSERGKLAPGGDTHRRSVALVART